MPNFGGNGVRVSPFCVCAIVVAIRFRCYFLSSFRCVTVKFGFLLKFSRRKCTESDHRPYSHACMFQCIEHFYDKKFCNTCSTKTNRIKLIENAILDSLLMYDFVRYDNDTESIISMPACSGETRRKLI